MPASGERTSGSIRTFPSGQWTWTFPGAIGATSAWPARLVQKAAVAGCPILVGVGAPTSLAVELAADRGMTLCGFARAGKVNVYAGAERVG
jgi:formate dehydrogenase accessory protein FdhD